MSKSWMDLKGSGVDEIKNIYILYVVTFVETSGGQHVQQETGLACYST